MTNVVVALFRGPWDLEVATNAVVYERCPLSWPHPHPEIEAYRSSLVTKLRQAYQEMCHSREGYNHNSLQLIITRAAATTGVDQRSFNLKSEIKCTLSRHQLIDTR